MAAPQRGSGFRLRAGDHATWFSFGRSTNPATRFLIDQSARPWGATGDGPEVHTQFTQRYAGGDGTVERRGGMTPQGEANERAWHTKAVLEAASKDGLFGDGWDHNPTEEEINDYAFTVTRGTGLYARYAHLFDPPTTTPPPHPTTTPPPHTTTTPAPTTTTAPMPALLEVPPQIRETVRHLKEWPAGRPLGPGITAHIGELSRWLDSVALYKKKV